MIEIINHSYFGVDFQNLFAVNNGEIQPPNRALDHLWQIHVDTILDKKNP